MVGLSTKLWLKTSESQILYMFSITIVTLLTWFEKRQDHRVKIKIQHRMLSWTSGIHVNVHINTPKYTCIRGSCWLFAIKGLFSATKLYHLFKKLLSFPKRVSQNVQRCRKSGAWWFLQELHSWKGFISWLSQRFGILRAVRLEGFIVLPCW